MAKKEKRREADFTTSEMMKLSNCKSKQTFMNRLNLVCGHYGINPMLFKMDEEFNNSENIFPAECGELLALLVKHYKVNPAVKADKELKGVTSESIYVFYEELMKDIDQLPDEIKNMVYAVPSYFTTNRIMIWIKKLAPIITQFILSYIDEKGEDMGALLQYLCVNIDKKNYDLFWNQKFLSMAEEANEEELKNSIYFFYGNGDDKEEEFKKRINTNNVSIDATIAELIKRIMLDIDKDEILDHPDSYENKMKREERYKLLNQYTLPRAGQYQKEILDKYKKGAQTWETVEEKIRQNNYIPDDAILTYESELEAREKYILELKKELEDAENDLERFRNQGSDFIKNRYQGVEELIENINSAYLEKCEHVRKDEKKLIDWTDRYLSRVMWEFLNKK